MKKTLIAYYSRAGENYFGGTLKELETGNTELAARMIADLTGGKLFKIEQSEPYSESYNECIDQAWRDARNGARPKIKALSDDITDFDTVYLGFPNYWGSAPMAVFTFLDGVNLSGKDVYLFCTHEGSGMGSAERDIKKEYGIKPSGSLALRGCRISDSRSEIEKWIKSTEEKK